MNGYVLCGPDGIEYLVVGENAVDAARKLGGDPDNYGVSASLDLSKPVHMGQFWPMYTHNPPAWCMENRT